MIDLLIAAALASSPPTTPALEPAAAVVQPALDTPQERQALRRLTICVAGLRPRWARSMLSYPYLSDPQASVAAQLVSGHDHCLGAPEVAVAFRTSSVVGFAAEYFIRTDAAATDPARLATALATIPSLNASEDFALCLASRTPKAALDLVLSDPGGADEAKAVSVVGATVPYCTKAGERLNVDVQALRALVATALYRGMTAVGRQPS
jgi:hypothetical protein